MTEERKSERKTPPSGDFLVRNLTLILVSMNGLVLSLVAFIATCLFITDLRATSALTGEFSRIAGYIPPGVLIIGVFLTFVMAFQSYVRRRQDRNMVRMAHTLKGRTAELQAEMTEREKLFQTLRRNEREYRAVINSVSDVIFEMDKDGIIKFLNQTWEKLTGKDPKSSIDESLFDLLWPEDRKREQEQFEALVSGQKHAYRSETRILTAGGTYRAVELAVSMLRLTEDKSVRVVGTITDIEKRRQAEQALRDAEHKYRSIVENAVRGIYQSTPDGRFLSANKALADILGYHSPEDLISSVKDIGSQVYVDSVYRKDLARILREQGSVKNLESQVRRKDGSLIWISEDSRAVCDRDGIILYYEGGVEDMTSRREAEDALRDAKLEAEITARAKSDFLANMSHELRTPLNAIIGFSEILKNEVFGKLGSDSYKEYSRDIHDSGKRLLHIINEILEVSRIETGKKQLKEEVFHVSEAVASCMEILAPRINDAGLTAEIRIADKLPKVRAEKLALKQILLNLMNNAVKFTPRGGQIVISADMSSSGEMRIEVIDTGIGIAEEDIPRALSPFGQLNTSLDRNQSGTGLGLTIVELLTKLHGGNFELLSKPGTGTTARISLPASRVIEKA